MLPHARHSEQFTNAILSVRILEEQADEFNRHLGLNPVEDSPSVVQGGLLGLPHRSALQQQLDAVPSPRDLVPGRLVVDSIAVTHSVEILPPKVANASLERARATVGSVVWIRAEVEKI